MNKISSLNRWKIEITWKAKKSNYLSVIIKLWKDLYRCNQMSNAYSSISFAINFRMKMNRKKVFQFFRFWIIPFSNRIVYTYSVFVTKLISWSLWWWWWWLKSWFFHQTKLSACVCVGQEKMKKKKFLPDNTTIELTDRPFKRPFSSL